MPTWEERAAAMRDRAEASKQRRREAQQARDEKRQEVQRKWEEAKANLRALNPERNSPTDDGSLATETEIQEEAILPLEASPMQPEALATPAKLVELAPDTAISTTIEPLVSGLESLVQAASVLAPASPIPTTPVTPATGQRVDSIDPRVRTKIPDFVAESLHESEQILGTFRASLIDHQHRENQFRHDKFVVTDQRIICYFTAVIHKGMSQIPYSVITNIDSNRGFRHGKVIINTSSGVGLTIDGINNEDAAFIERIIAGSLAGRTFVANS